ncbi:hypothetical protein GQX73_g501 [Xylaria multiplex]|uniref:O-methyltransferase C-terminal domain-containing protein n=1 Tax=Xylaria multiplex TaxID=323545 RepID=A0A7C8IV44_9PEZI|nr:hypothetical protein GQX73_g501 [Xylaria multiplex]
MATSKPTRIALLSTIIQKNIEIIDAYFDSNGLPSPSFDQDYPSDLAPEIHGARNAVLEATDELSDLMLGPRQIAECHPPQHTSLVGIQAINRWNVADNLEENEEATFSEVSRRCGVHEDIFKRVMRQAISKHIFKEPRDGVIAHNAASKLFRSPGLLPDYISVALDDVWPSATRMLDAWGKWDFSQDPDKTGFNLVENTTSSYFQSMRSNEKRRKAFSNVMSYMQSRPGFGSGYSHMISAFDWNSVSKVIDIGGGLGDTGAYIVQNTSKTHYVVQDLPDVIEEAIGRGMYTELADRLTFMGHDFFQPQPMQNADAYFLRWILHDWSDPQAMNILRCLIPALKPGAHVIIQEFVIPPRGTLSFYHEKSIRCMDLAMAATFNSKERDIEAWIHLFQSTDPRFKFAESNIANGSNMAIIRFTWDDSISVTGEPAPTT